MRLHALSVTAFGPFAGTVEVDLDALAEDGLFLIRGATGAGKTSLLDAVAFALYADVPGARSKKGLHSDHAERSAVPSVSLELTAAGRRLRIDRSPEFYRPKARGSGLTKVPAKAVLSELRGAGWAVVSTRHDEIADVVKDVLGLGLEQFSKVVLLPQGDFAAFLRATPEERRGLLERLFDVSAFGGVEEWFAERRRESADAAVAQRTALQADLAVLTEVLAQLPATTRPPATSQLPEAAAPASAGPEWSSLELSALPAALAEVEGALTEEVTASLARVELTRLAEADATARQLAGAEVAARRLRGSQATATLLALENRQAEHAEALAALEAAERAAGVAGDLKALDRARHALAIAGSRRDQRLAALRERGIAVDPTSLHELPALQDDMAAGGAHLADAARLVAALGRREAQREVLEQQADRAHRLGEALRDELAAAAAAGEAATGLLERAVSAQERAAGYAAEVARLERLLAVRRAYDAGAAQARAAKADLLVARESAQDLRDAYQDLRQARLDGMAGELAASLRDHEPCPVCGAAEHPQPAVPSREVSPGQVDTAEDAWHAAAARVQQHERDLAALEAALVQQREELGPDASEESALRDGLAEARARLDAARALAGARAQHETAVRAAQTTLSGLTERQARARDEQVGARTAVEALSRDQADDQAALQAALDAHAAHCPCAANCPCAADGPDGLAALTGLHDDTRLAVDAVLAALADVQRAEEQAIAVTDLTTAALAAAGFDDAAQAAAASLAPDVMAGLRTAVREYERSLVVAQTTLADPEIQQAMQGDEPDLEALARTAEQAHTAYTDAVARDALLRRALAGVQRVGGAIVERCAALAQTQSQHELLRQLADTVAGTGADNALRMRLSAYVLAARLEKVAALANERLSTMGEGRYQLRHTDELAARGARSGLGLEVLDLWTGQARDTASLSGGESFMASLALALGLADAVREESGGFDLQTLFVDEGFGTLDDESLEQVMTVLDGLREGGRAVGVVSHVAELRTRIPRQVVVSKTARGSSVQVTRTDDAAPAA